tara:strand:- start:183 stop:566 length:384 start_codon:yes stop_codon:yes gene_type:complete
MKKTRIIYWTTTALFCLLMLFSAFNYLTNPEMKSAFAHLGFPDYFRVKLAIAKILGALALLLPLTPKGFKYFAYAGFAINVISATIAHIASSDPLMVALAPLIFLAVLVVSFFYYEKMIRELKTVNN